MSIICDPYQQSLWSAQGHNNNIFSFISFGLQQQLISMNICMNKEYSYKASFPCKIISGRKDHSHSFCKSKVYDFFKWLLYSLIYENLYYYLNRIFLEEICIWCILKISKFILLGTYFVEIWCFGEFITKINVSQQNDVILTIGYGVLLKFIPVLKITHFVRKIMKYKWQMDNRKKMDGLIIMDG